MANGNGKVPVSVKEMASYCGVSKQTVARWIEQGILQAEQRADGAYEIRRRVAAQFLIEHNYRAPYDILGTRCLRVLIVHDDRQLLDRLTEGLLESREILLVASAESAAHARMKMMVFRPDALVVKSSMVERVVKDREAICGSGTAGSECRVVSLGPLGAHDDRWRATVIRESQPTEGMICEILEVLEPVKNAPSHSDARLAIAAVKGVDQPWPAVFAGGAK